MWPLCDAVGVLGWGCHGMEGKVLGGRILWWGGECSILLVDFYLNACSIFLRITKYPRDALSLKQSTALCRLNRLKQNLPLPCACYLFNAPNAHSHAQMPSHDQCSPSPHATYHPLLGSSNNLPLGLSLGNPPPLPPLSQTLHPLTHVSLTTPLILIPA